MEIKCWGSRGSISVSGKQFLKYGGDTTCIEITTRSNDSIIIDAGTGLRELGNERYNGTRDSEPHTFYILLSQLHWDHIHGIPLFAPFMAAQSRIELISDKGASW